MNPAYRPAHPPTVALTCAGTTSRHDGGTSGAHARLKALSRASRARPLASGTRWPSGAATRYVTDSGPGWLAAIGAARRVTRLSRLCCEVFPGQADDVDFFWCRLARARCLKSGGDDDAAELAGHVSGRGLGLGGVPGSAGAMFAGVGGVVAGGGIPAGRLWSKPQGR